MNEQRPEVHAHPSIDEVKVLGGDGDQAFLSSMPVVAILKKDEHTTYPFGVWLGIVKTGPFRDQYVGFRSRALNPISWQLRNKHASVTIHLWPSRVTSVPDHEKLPSPLAMGVIELHGEAPIHWKV
ncbi:MAG: hypothetical protein AAGI89_07415 [Pseudomonadota bacterium]